MFKVKHILFMLNSTGISLSICINLSRYLRALQNQDGYAQTCVKCTVFFNCCLVQKSLVDSLNNGKCLCPVHKRWPGTILGDARGCRRWVPREHRELRVGSKTWGWEVATRMLGGLWSCWSRGYLIPFVMVTWGRWWLTEDGLQHKCCCMLCWWGTEHAVRD